MPFGSANGGTALALGQCVTYDTEGGNPRHTAVFAHLVLQERKVPAAVSWPEEDRMVSGTACGRRSQAHGASLAVNIRLEKEQRHSDSAATVTSVLCA